MYKDNNRFDSFRKIATINPKKIEVYSKTIHLIKKANAHSINSGARASFKSVIYIYIYVIVEFLCSEFILWIKHFELYDDLIPVSVYEE